MTNYILGISAFYHDSAAVLLKDGQIIGAVEEERLSRIKGDSDFPIRSINYLLNLEGIEPHQISNVVYYDKPMLTFGRLLQSYLEFPFKSWKSFSLAIPEFINRKLKIRNIILESLSGFQGEIFFSKHHESHAASAYFLSGFDSAAVLVADGVGEWACTSIGLAKGNEIKFFAENSFPHSIGLFYSSVTQYLGFKVNSDEYKLMGLAPYGVPRFKKIMMENLIKVNQDGSILLNLEYFNFPFGLTMINEKKWQKLFGQGVKTGDQSFDQFHMDVAASCQSITTEVILHLARELKSRTGLNKLVMAGGVALNCVANGEIMKERIFDEIFIQPAAGDAGGALGAAYHLWFTKFSKVLKVVSDDGDRMHGSYLGPTIENEEVRNFLQENSLEAKFIREEDIPEAISNLIVEGKTIGIARGRMEFGPRALGNRSIIGDPRNEASQSTINMKIKFRESFRPFAPAILLEKLEEFFDYKKESPYMLLALKLKNEVKENIPEVMSASGFDKLRIRKSSVPSITHVDYSVRIQTVTSRRNATFHSIIEKFYEKTGCPMIINTSFNLAGEPIVCNHKDAYYTFMMSELDYVLIGNYLLSKER
jgi:carbamoyltransferase